MKKIVYYPYLFVLWITNRIINYIPISFFRKVWYRSLGAKISRYVQIDMGQYILAPSRLQIDTHTHVNEGCLIDARGGIHIGSNVSISHRCSLVTGSHNVLDSDFAGIFAPITISNDVFIGANATILQGITVHRGAIVCAGAVVTKDVAEYNIVAGIPAQMISLRDKKINYTVKPDTFFC